MKTLRTLSALVLAFLTACGGFPLPLPPPPADDEHCQFYGCDDPSELEDPLCVLTGAQCFCDPDGCGPSEPKPCIP